MIEQNFNLISATIRNPKNKIIHIEVIKNMVNNFWFQFHNEQLYYLLKEKLNNLINRIIK